jgi:hypothetical protein
MRARMRRQLCGSAANGQQVCRSAINRIAWHSAVRAGHILQFFERTRWSSPGARGAWSDVKWCVVERIVWAPVLTLPVTSLLGYGLEQQLHALGF